MKYLAKNFVPTQEENELLSKHGFARIPLDIPFPLPPVNVVLVKGEHGDALIDCGMPYKQNFQWLEAELEKYGSSFQNIQEIYMTHPHIDHFAMAMELIEVTGATLHCWQPSQERFEKAYEFWDRDYDDFIQQMTALGVTFSRQSSSKAYLEKVQPLKITHTFEAEERLTIAGRPVLTKHLPGHSPWCMGFFFQDCNVLVGGDVLLKRISSNPIWYPESASPKEWQGLQSYQHSLKQLAGMPIEMVIPGHEGSFVRVQKVVEKALEEQHLRRTEVFQIIQQAGSITVEELGVALFGKERAVSAYFLVFSEIMRNIDWLENKQMIQRVYREDKMLIQVQKV